MKSATLSRSFALLGALLAAQAHAQAPVATTAAATTSAAPSAPAPDEDAEYHALVDEALAEYGAGHYEEARALFLRAHAQKPSARTHRGIGLAEYELRNYPECITQLEAALASSERPLTGQVRASTQDVLSRANRYVARVAVRTLPDDALISVDRVPVGRSPGAPLVLRVGEHLLEARAEGYIPSSRVVTVLGGADLGVELVLTPIAPPVAEAPLPVAAPVTAQVAPVLPAPSAELRDQPARRWYRSPWLWGAVGVVAVGAAVGVGVAATRGGEAPSAPDYPVVPGP